MSTKILFLHLSDIHIRHETDEILKRAERIAAATYQRLPEIHTLAVVLSGDVSWSGTAAQFALAEKFINEIKSAVHRQSSTVNIQVFVAPGNHDCDFSLSDETREAVLDRVRSLEDGDPSSSLVNTATSVQKEFFSFRDRVSNHPWSVDSRLSWQTSLDIEGIKVGVRCLNVAWMSELKEKQGTLVFPPSTIEPFDFDKSGGLSVTLLHHPFNWFGQSTYRSFQTAVRHESHIVLTGHEHFQNIGEVADLKSSPSIFVEGGVLFESSAKNISTFNIVLVDLKSEQYVTELYSWDGRNYSANVDTEEWGSLRTLPVKARQRFDLNSDFLVSLRDPGANFSHSAKKSLDIDDIYVWPELLCLDDPALVKKQVSGSYLEDIENLNSGVFIRGDEKSGKSALLRRYFQSYYERGYLPLYFRASWFTKGHQSDPLRAVKFALERQYKKSSHQAWLQESKDERILLLDDLDFSDLSPSVLSACLDGLFGYFSSIILTATDGAAATDLLSIDRVEALSHFTQYEIREFGHKKRFELVCKWAEIGGHADESSAKWMTTIDKWEKDLTAAVGRQFVPSVPIFLLTLLQSIESGRTADLQNSAFGHYYQFLVTSALQNIGIEREQWSEVMNYCANLAWFVHSSGKKHFPESVFKEFNKAFSSEFTPVSEERRLRDLMAAGVLAKREGEIEFKYPYLYYYFLGQYLADRIHEPDIQGVVSELSDDLHLRDNANILLFASHHTKSPVVYERIVSTLDRCFDSDVTFDFERDVQLLNQLVDAAPQLIYQEESTKSSRAKIRENQDKATAARRDAENTETDVFSAITRLFRAMEILGQFLKNHYGTTKNPVKDELIDKLLQSALRGLHGITHVLIEDTDALASHIERILAERRPDVPSDVRKTQAKRIVFDIVGMITFGFVQKAATAVGSPYLKENLQSVVEKNNTLGYSLIEMSYLFDLPGTIPFTKLKQLSKSVEKNVFSRALLRSMALRHLHLFKVSYKEKQKLCEELDITLSKQLALQNERADRSR